MGVEKLLDMGRRIPESELIINENGSVYHLNLKPEHIADNVIFVGDQYRVPMVTEHFDSIEADIQKREFRTIVGTYKGTRFTVMSTGIGPDNIDIALNELDALVNIDFKTREIKEQLKKLNIVRIGTSGSLHSDIPVDSYVVSSHGLGLAGMMHAYDCEQYFEKDIEEAFIDHTNWNMKRGRPYVVTGGADLISKLHSDQTHLGITGTANGFYGPQGRVLRLPLANPDLNKQMDSFVFNKHRVTNLEMETSAIYGLAKQLGHQACSINAIIANRANGTFSEDYQKTVKNLIIYTLDKLST